MGFLCGFVERLLGRNMRLRLPRWGSAWEEMGSTCVHQTRVGADLLLR